MMTPFSSNVCSAMMDFSINYYASTYGIDMVESLAEDIEEPVVSVPQMGIPPPIGFGSDEDSLQSFYHIIPKPPKRDADKNVELEGTVLRWLAKLDSKNPDDMDRRFVVSFHMSDGTVSIYEPPIQNSGIMGGKILERMKVHLVLADGEEGPEVTYQDLKAASEQGTPIRLNCFTFVIMESDRYTSKLIDKWQSSEV